ncbi:MAG: PH domain-containing protein, partial [Terrabacter sp.]
MIPAPGEGWARLDPRKLLLDPVKAIGQAIVPVVVALVGISQSDTRFWPLVLPLVVLGPVVLGALPWLTTLYRITDTQIQVRSGVLNKRTSTAPLDRVRSVDLEASLLHRVLGLQKVQVGTGVDDDRITLDALARADAHALRTTLLRRREDTPATPPTDLDTEERRATAPAAAAAVVLARIDWSWLRFAPFSLARLVLLAGAVGVVAQFGDDLPIWNQETATSAWQWVTQFAVVAVALVLAVGGLALWLVVSVTGYVVQWWGFRLVREHGSLHLSSGLFTTRSITVEEAKVRGVEMVEPVLLRVVGGAEMSTLATGVEDGVTQVLPPCPRDVVVGVGGAVLDEPGALAAPLVAHGPRARRRAWFRQLRGALGVVAVAAVAWWFAGLSWAWFAALAVVLLVLGAAVGETSYRHLGHALLDRHLVAGGGSLARVRTVLETDGIIGWVVSQSWWQRRIGLADLT